MINAASTSPGRGCFVPRNQAGGFLLEISLVMLVAGVLTVATFEAHSTLRKRQQAQDAQSLLLAIDASIRSFVIRERRMPCPATSLDGVENGANGVCALSAGGVPYITLGMELPQTSQGQVFRYGVAPTLFDPDTEPLLQRALAFSREGANTAVPYVAAADGQRRFSVCGLAATSPAYALMWMPGPAQGMQDLCFHEQLDDSRGFYAVGGLEFLGWLQQVLAPLP